VRRCLVSPWSVGLCWLPILGVAGWLGSDPCPSGRVAYSWGQTLAFRGVSLTAGVRPLPFGACRLRLGSDPCLSGRVAYSWGQILVAPRRIATTGVSFRRPLGLRG